MIHKKNIALVIDTNILADILKIGNSDNIMIVLKEWISKIIVNMEKQPKGKKITIFASTSTIHDYKTGLIKAGHKKASKNVKLVFTKLLSQKTPISRSQKIDLSLKKIATNNSKQKKRIRDKNDENFLILIEAITKIRNWEDYGIIFASKDRQSTPEIEEVFLKRNNTRLQVASDLRTFEKLIEC